jgi:hypothetical protein
MSSSIHFHLNEMTCEDLFAIQDNVIFSSVLSIKENYKIPDIVLKQTKDWCFYIKEKDGNIKTGT